MQRTGSGEFRVIGLARDRDSPENPGALDRRVALVPDDIRTLVTHGCTVFVEAGAGERVGFDDRQYEAAGAVIQPPELLYGGKDLIVKLKGPAMQDVAPGVKPALVCHPALCEPTRTLV